MALRLLPSYTRVVALLGLRSACRLAPPTVTLCVPGALNR